MPKLGYLLPTRERIMEGRDEIGSPLAHQVATFDRLAEGRLILGIGIATDMPNIGAEFEAADVPFDKRVGRWKVTQGVVGPMPHQPGGPPVWIGGSVAAARERTGRLVDGWFSNAPSPAEYGVQWAEVQAAAHAAGPDPAALTPAMYLALALDDDAARAEDRINRYLERCYDQRPDVMRRWQMCFAGDARAGDARAGDARAGDARADGAWLKSYGDAGVEHMCLHLPGDLEPQMDAIARVRAELGW